eukprot:jgi/Botrbrau1/9918/Bobra.0012s0018.1
MIQGAMPITYSDIILQTKSEICDTNLVDFLPDICPDLDLSSPDFPCVPSVFQCNNTIGEAVSPQGSTSPRSNHGSTGARDTAMTSQLYSEEDKLVLKYTDERPQVLTPDTPNLTSIYSHLHQAYVDRLQGLLGPKGQLQHDQFPEIAKEIIAEIVALHSFVSRYKPSIQKGAADGGSDLLYNSSEIDLLLSAICLTTEQASKMAVMHSKYIWSVQSHAQTRQKFAQMTGMADGFAFTDGTAACRLSLLTTAIRQLQITVQREVEDVCNFTKQCLCEVLTPAQAACALTMSFPAFPNVMGLANHIRQTKEAQPCSISRAASGPMPVLTSELLIGELPCLPSAFASPTSVATKEAMRVLAPCESGQPTIPMDSGNSKRRLLGRTSSWGGPHACTAPLPPANPRSVEPATESGCTRHPSNNEASAQSMMSVGPAPQSASLELTDLEALVEPAQAGTGARRILKTKRSGPTRGTGRAEQLVRQQSLDAAPRRGAIPLGVPVPDIQPQAAGARALLDAAVPAGPPRGAIPLGQSLLKEPASRKPLLRPSLSAFEPMCMPPIAAHESNIGGSEGGPLSAAARQVSPQPFQLQAGGSMLPRIRTLSPSAFQQHVGAINELRSSSTDTAKQLARVMSLTSPAELSDVTYKCRAILRHSVDVPNWHCTPSGTQHAIGRFENFSSAGPPMGLPIGQLDLGRAQQHRSHCHWPN